MKQNDTVKFAAPHASEENDLFKVLEIRDDRVLLAILNTGMSIVPTVVYPVADMVQA